MRIAILAYVEKEGGREFDVAIKQVAGALRENGHTVSILGVHADIRKLITGIGRREPELVFNMLEDFGDSPYSYIAAVGVLDLLGVPYTGCGPGELYLAQDKALAKKLLAFENILYPRFAVFSTDKDLETGGNLRMPMFVKPLAQDASVGIGKKSLVKDATELMRRVLAIHDELGDDALAEEFIDGREFYVGVLGNQEALALRPIEADFSGLPENAPKVYDRKAKWEPGSVEYKGIKTGIAELPDEMRAKLEKVSLDAYRAVRARDYGRVDLRVTAAGEIYVLEVNASCYLEQNDEFAVAARATGIEYPALIQKIVDLAMARRG